MNRLYVHLVLICGLFLAACAPPPEEPDWCHTYNFALSVDGINIQSGEWIAGVGIQTENNEIIMNWSEDFFINQTYMSVTFVRPSGVEGTIQVAAIADIFGQGISQSFPFPAESSSETVGINRDSNTATQDVSLTLQSDQPILIQSLYISGDGESPFPLNPCGPQTPTPPATITNTPPATITNTPEPTITRTPTPTGTPPVCFRLDYDFRISAYDSLDQPIHFGAWVPGVGIVPQEFHPNSTQWAHLYSIRVQGDGLPIRRIEFEFSSLIPGSVGLGDWQLNLFSGGSNVMEVYPAASTYFSWDGAATGGSVRFSGYIGNDQTSPVTDPGGSAVLERITIFGVGTPTSWDGVLTSLPCWDITPTPTLTPSATVATNTPTNTLTRTPLPITPQTATATRTNIVISSATPAPTFTLTNTLIPSLPPAPSETPGPSATPVDTRTLIPLPTSGEGTPTAEGTYGLPNFGTLPPDPVFATLIGTMPPDVTPLLTGIPLPAYKSDVYNYVSTAAAGINQLPSDITSQIPEVGPGLSLFGQYAKGLTSGVSLQELLGKKLYPIGVHVFYAIAVVFSMSVIYALVYIGVEVIKFVIWVIGWILKIIGAIAGAA